MTGYLFLYELTKLALCNNTIIVLYCFTTIVLCQCADPPSNQPSCMASCSGYSTADECATPCSSMRYSAMGTMNSVSSLRATGLSLRATTRNPCPAWQWIPDQVRDDKPLVRDDKPLVRHDKRGMVRHASQRQIRNLSERLLVGVHRHQTGKTAGQTGLRALDLANHAVHCRKLLGVAL